MKAVGYNKPLAIDHPEALLDIQLPQPSARGRDLLVKVNAVSVNPVEYKLRQTQAPVDCDYRVLGWDAAGEVVDIGPSVEHFKVGDRVYYAGDVSRQGCHAEYQLVDERIVGVKPQILSDAETAALPLTSITAWELLFDHLGLQQQSPQATERSDEVLLVVGAAGGVGSILVQLAKVTTGATVIGTASRQSSSKWITSLGADHVIDHSKPLRPQLEALGLANLTHIASLNGTTANYDTYIDLLVPFGKIGMIDNSSGLDPAKLKQKSLSLHTEYMFARTLYQAADMGKQSWLLNQVAALIDDGHIKTTLGAHLGLITADNVRRAHQTLETHKAIGKMVMEGF